MRSCIFKKVSTRCRLFTRKGCRQNNIDRTFNQALYRAEQQLLNSEGLPGREWYKHALYAPGYYTGYGVKTMPGIREAIEQRDWELAQQQINTDAGILEGLALYFDNMATEGD